MAPSFAANYSILTTVNMLTKAESYSLQFASGAVSADVFL